MKLAFWRDPAKEQLAEDRLMVGVMQKRLIELDKQKDNIESEELFISRQLPKIKQRIGNTDPLSAHSKTGKATGKPVVPQPKAWTEREPVQDPKTRVMQAQTDVANDRLTRNGMRNTQAGNSSNANSLHNIKTVVFPVTSDDPNIRTTHLYGPYKLTWNELLRRAMVKMSHEDTLASATLDQWEQKAWDAFQEVQRNTSITEFDDNHDEPLI